MLARILALTATALALSPSAFAAAGGCHTVSGTYVNHPAPCPVPALTCVESILTGDQAGTVLTVITAFDPATNTFTGTTTNVLENGAVLESSIVGTFLNGEGHSVSTLTGGTHQYAHATGVTRSQSVNGVGTYEGMYCLGNPKDEN